MNDGGSRLTIALAQIDPTVGDLEANAALIADAIAAGRDAGAALVVCPELCLPGYPAEDLYLKRHFLEANVAALERIASEATGVTALVGFAEPVDAEPSRRHDAPARRPAHNSVAVLRNGVTQEFHHVEALKAAGGTALTTSYWLPDAAFDETGG